MKIKIGAKLYGGFGVALAVLVVIAVVSYTSVNSLIRNEAQVTHTHEVIESVAEIDSALKDAETGQRGFRHHGCQSLPGAIHGSDRRGRWEDRSPP